MINFDRNRFDDMTTSEKIAFVNDLVIKNTMLNEKEMEYLIPDNREKYFFNRVKTSDWLEDYEFNSMSDNEKRIYIWGNRYLQGINIAKLTPDLQKEYIGSTISSGLQMTSDEFNHLSNDDVRKYYVEEKLRFSTPTTLTAEELTYLDSKGQIKYINNVIRMGLAPNTDEIETFKPEAMRYYQTHKSLNEIRSVVRSELRKILK
jgi:hypothetical protein